MAKKLIDIDLPEAGSEKQSGVPVIPAEGDAVRRYNEAYDQAKDAVGVMEQLRGELVDQGLDYIFRHNKEHADEPKAQIQSVRLMCAGETELPTETLTVTWTKKALKTSKAVVEAWFDRASTVLRRYNINDYVQYVVKSKFDESIFDDPATGKFSPARFDQVKAALDAVSRKLGATNPLASFKTLVPNAAFNETKRWQDFSVEQNIELTEVLPTQINLQPVRTNGEGK